MAEQRETSGGGATPAKKRRFSRRTVRLFAWGAGMVSFALPWAVTKGVTTISGAPAQQVVVVPAGSKVVVTKAPPGATSGVTVVSVKGGKGAPAPVTTTGWTPHAPTGV